MTATVAMWRDRIQGYVNRLGTAQGPAGRFGAAAPSPGPDRVLGGAVLALVAFGVVMVFSAGAVRAAREYDDWTFFLKREAIYAIVGLCAFAFAVRTDYAAYRRLTYPLLFLSVGLLVLVRLIGPNVNGAVRWFRIGSISFQPSELAKFALILYLAVLLARKADKVRDFSVGFLPPLVMTGIFVGLLLVQPDFGTAVIMGVAALVMLFVAGTRTSYIVLSVLIAAPLGWKLFIVGEPFRMQRWLAFLSPWEHRAKAGYQLVGSLLSLGSGEVWGVGLGESRQKLGFLPEAHTDFILAIVGEELGLVGIMAVITGFGVLVWRGLRAALRARDVFGCYLAFGVTTLFGLQAVMNMAVVMGLMPTKGLPLPFISYGGTALVMNLFMAGVLLNVSARQPEPRATPSLFSALKFRVPKARNRRSVSGVRVVVDLSARRRGRIIAPPDRVTDLSWSGQSAAIPQEPMMDDVTEPDTRAGA